MTNVYRISSNRMYTSKKQPLKIHMKHSKCWHIYRVDYIKPDQYIETTSNPFSNAFNANTNNPKQFLLLNWRLKKWGKKDASKEKNSSNLLKETKTSEKKHISQRRSVKCLGKTVAKVKLKNLINYPSAYTVAQSAKWFCYEFFCFTTRLWHFWVVARFVFSLIFTRMWLCHGYLVAFDSVYPVQKVNWTRTDDLISLKRLSAVNLRLHDSSAQLRRSIYRWRESWELFYALLKHGIDYKIN